MSTGLSVELKFIVNVESRSSSITLPAPISSQSQMFGLVWITTDWIDGPTGNEMSGPAIDVNTPIRCNKNVSPSCSHLCLCHPSSMPSNGRRCASDDTLCDESSPLLGDPEIQKPYLAQPTPLPKAQLAALCAIRLADPIAFTQVSSTQLSIPPFTHFS